jgi:hypothetical protein
MVGLFASLGCISAGPSITPNASVSTTLHNKSSSIVVQPSPSTSLLPPRHHPKEDQNPQTNTDSSLCILIFEILSFLCTQPNAYDIVLNVLSEVKGEQYRFERLIQSLYHIISPTKAPFSSANSLDDETILYDCATAALSLFNAIVQTPKSMDRRNSLRKELERRGLDDFLKVIKEKISQKSFFFCIVSDSIF